VYAYFDCKPLVFILAIHDAFGFLDHRYGHM
jgi:hypothetical protein